ncbi:MAG TPA: F0F1 ATP synthase subunit delta [Candidatus Babeliaceae bacterium]|nr:F0F1 ATP synthase subunit delta [Candidatus Babeliaceae bacterium]
MMTEKLTTIARPYALAAFEYALESHDLKSWENLLYSAALITRDKTMSQLLSSPEVTQGELCEIYCDILSKLLDAQKKNYIQLIAEYERFEALPEIANLFAKYQADYEKTMTVKVISAIPLDKSHEQKYIDALTRRLKRKITLDCEVDKSLLGGAIIRAGDIVIDGSVRGKLNRLFESL